MSTAPSFLNTPAQNSKRDVPLLVPIVIALLVAGLLALAYTQYHASKDESSGFIGEVRTAELPDKAHVLVTIELNIRDLDDKPLVVFSVETRLKAGGQEYADGPSAAGELPRYFKAYPAITSSQSALTPDTKIEPQQQKTGVIAVSYPVSKDVFDKRERLEVKVNFREHRPLSLHLP